MSTFPKGKEKGGKKGAKTAVLFLALSFLGGCSVFSSGSAPRVHAVSVEQRENGFLIELPGSETNAASEAFVTRQGWVIITIVDPLYDLSPLDRFSSSLIDSMEYKRFTSAVQVSLRFRPRVTEATVVSKPADPSILVSVFAE